MQSQTKRELIGAVVQLVRIPACQAGGRGFESRPHRQREHSSVGLEHLPYKQRVGGSTPSAPTRKAIGNPIAFFFYNPQNMKDRIYKDLVQQLAALIKGETDETGVLANASALMMTALKHHWIGFYLVRENPENGRNELWLGPFQGPAACYRIGYGKGVCGTAWASGETVIVPDVDAFPGHIACSSLSRSEIVVPIFRNGEVGAVLDIDSADLNSFDDTDRRYLEQICQIISETIYKF